MPDSSARKLGVIALAAFAAGATVVACHSSKPRPVLAAIVVPGVPPESALFIRGTDEAAGALSNDDQTEIVDRVLTNYYYPPDAQARWLDPRPLAHVRAPVADDTVGTDPDFAEEVVKSVGNPRTCLLGGRDYGCRGKTGAVVRFSWPYRTGKDSAVVFAILTPRDSLGVAGKPEPERQFRLFFHADGYWEMRRSTLVNPAEAKKP